MRNKILNLLKKSIYILTAIILTITSSNAETNKETNMTTNKKILIAYYSWSSNTKEVAEAIHKKIGGDIYRIETEQTYPEEYRATTAQAKREINEGFHPTLKGKVENISQYDIIFIGSPNWWGTIAPAVSSFLADNNLKGKTVIPFITHGGGGAQNTITDLTQQCKECIVNKNSWVGYGSRTIGISGWLEELKIN